MSQLVAQETFDNTCVELITLGPGWGEWTAQVNVYRMDGRDYGKAGERVRVSMANHRHLEFAQLAYSATVYRWRGL